MIWQVCAALARRFGTSTTTMRTVFIRCLLHLLPASSRSSPCGSLLPSEERPPVRPGDGRTRP
ncbi:PspC domain-containing protein [Streptomyces thinghirensis]|nr:PspC domain-containing protein [Streptomyces thinghirensis]